MARILVLPGDGIGPEVTEQARRVLEAAARRFGLALDFEHVLVSHGEPVLRNGRAALERALSR